MKDGAETIKIRKKMGAINENATKTKGESRTLDSVISGILKDLVENCVKNKDNLHITGEDVCLFMKKLNEEAQKEYDNDNKKNAPLSELKLFSLVEHYYRFHLQNRKYQSFRVEFKEQKGEDKRVALEGKFNDLINFANDPSRDKANKANAFNLSCVLIQHIYQALNSDSNSDQPHQYGECSREAEGGYMMSGYVPLNDYHKSELLTWDRLLQEDGKYKNSVYPYCKFQELDDHERIILLIVTKLEENYVDDKVMKVDKIPPIHMLILKSPALIDQGDSERESIEFKLRNTIGYLSYAIFAGRTNDSLASMSTEASLVARYWNSTGIDKLFTVDEHGEKINGSKLANRIVKEILCAKVEGLTSLEVFPFDRVFLFPGSNFRCLNIDASTKRWDNNPMRLSIIEAAVKSKRPQDNDRFLSTMERLENKGDYSEQPNLDIFFDVTQKISGFTTEADCTMTSNDKCELIIVDTNYREEFNKIIETLEEERGEIKDEKGKIEAVIKTLFSGFSRDTVDNLQAYCQLTYQYYDPDGICLLNDFAAKVKEIPGLKKIQDAYFKIFFDKEMEEWKRRWKGNPQNIPNLNEFKKWQDERESKVILISFDPFQNLSNMDQKGNRYLEKDDAFTLLLVADEDIVKNNFDLDTEILDLKQMVSMVIRRKLREAIMQKEVIREQKKLFTTMMSAIMHRFKSYTSHQAERIEIDTMREKFENVLKEENYFASFKEFHSVKNVSEYFLTSFIDEQSGDKLDQLASKGLKDKFELACNLYLEKLKVLKKAENLDVTDLEIKFNENYLPQIQIKLRDEFVKEAVKILINNAIEHTAIYAQKTKNKAEIILSFILSPQLGTDQYSFEFSIINSSFHIPQEKLEILNSPDPKEAEKDPLKASSTGIGIFIARTQLQKSIGKGADIQLDNVEGNYVEVKLILPAKKIVTHDEKIEKMDEVDRKSESIGHNYVLYVEDEIKYQENSKKALLKLLSDENRLFVCDNKQEAVAKIKSMLPSIVLMDLTILRQPGSRDAMPQYAFGVIKEVLKNNSITPIVVLSHKEAEHIKKSLTNLDLGDYQVKIKEFDKDVEIEEKSIIIPKHDIKMLSEDEGKFLIKALEKWIAKQPYNKEIHLDTKVTGGTEMSKKNMLQFLRVSFNDKNFDKKLEDYRTRNISDDIPNEVFIATANVNDEDMLFETLSRWFSHSAIKSFFEDEKDDDSIAIPLTENALLPTVFLNIQIEDKLKEIIDIKFKYWCLSHNILISGGDIEIDAELARKWRFTSHGDCGSLSTLRHDIKNKTSGEESGEIVAKITAVEDQVLFKEVSLDSDLKLALKNKDKTIIKTLKDRPDKKSINVTELFKELNIAFTRHKSPDQIQEFKVTIENLQGFLEK